MAGKVPELDGVRGAAVLLVFAVHWQNAWIAHSTADTVVQRVAQPGWLGVELFFVLSGFLITTGLLEQLGAAPTVGAYLRRFYWRRALRILPVYYAALLGLFVVLPHLITFHDPAFATLQSRQGWYWLYSVNWLSALHGPSSTPFNTGHFWSLAVEEQFYLGWPLIVWAVGERGLARACGILWLVSLVLRVAVAAIWPALFVPADLTPLHFDPLMAGALVALALRHPSIRSRAVRAAPGACLAVLALLGIVGAFAVVAHEWVIAPAAVAFAALLLVTMTLPGDHWLRRTLRTPILRSFGVYSYCLYVVHYPLIIVLDRALPRLHVPSVWGSNLPYALLYAGFLIGISYAISALSYRFFESPLLALKDLPRRASA